MEHSGNNSISCKLSNSRTLQNKVEKITESLCHKYFRYPEIMDIEMIRDAVLQGMQIVVDDH